MTLAIDGSTPAIVTNTSATVATITTASFTAPSGALLVAMWSGDTQANTDPGAPSISDTGGLTWTQRQWRHRSSGTPTVDGQAAIWTAVTASSASRTVTVTSGTASGARESAFYVGVLTDTGTPTVGTSGGASGTAITALSSTYVGTAASNWGLIVDCDWDLRGAQTAATGCTSIGSADVASAITYGFGRRTTADGTNGGNTTVGMTTPTNTTNGAWAYIEIVPNAGGAVAVPYVARQMTHLAARTSHAWSQVRARVNQSTSLPPLAMPLLRRSVPAAPTVGRTSYAWSQTRTPSGVDPAPVSLDVPTLHTVAPRWPRLTPVQSWTQVRACVDVSTIAAQPDVTSSLTLPVAVTHARPSWTRVLRAFDLPSSDVQPDVVPALLPSVAATHSRPMWLRLVSVVGPPLSDVVSDFDVTQAGYGWTARLTPATHADRHSVPTQQHVPVEIDVVLERDPTLSGALLTWLTANVAATHGGRRVLPSQRQPLADQSVQLSDADPTMAAWLPLSVARTWPTDRRSVPRQQSLISDPSTYPQVPPTDPLTLAYGVGSAIWQALNRAATHVDRRSVPTQHDYRSIVGLLDTALLDVPLLGAALAFATHREALVGWRVQTVPALRYYVPPPVAADVLLIAGADWRRRLTPATHASRPVLRLTIRVPKFIGSAQVVFVPGAMRGRPQNTATIHGRDTDDPGMRGRGWT